MGIEKIQVYICRCDNCGEEYDNGDYVPMAADETGIRGLVGDSDWVEEGGKYYCPQCYSIDDNDKLIIDGDRKITF
ncbi:MAG: hypothetical protein LBR26_16085 [Prevotella sp.]|jgi:hypothetical protein|nr:hypothetical protein [Prevotella sp.]